MFFNNKYLARRHIKLLYFNIILYDTQTRVDRLNKLLICHNIVIYTFFGTFDIFFQCENEPQVSSFKKCYR